MPAIRLFYVSTGTFGLLRFTLNASTRLLSHNITHAESDWFIDTAAGDLHLNAVHYPPVDSALFIPQLSDDFDKQPRPRGNGFDIGADEYSAVPEIGQTDAALAGILSLILD